MGEGDGDDPEGNLWVVGVVLVLLGSLGQNLGNNLVSLSHGNKNKLLERVRHRKQSFDLERARVSDLEDNQLLRAELARIDKLEDAESKPVAEAEEKKSHNALWLTGTGLFVAGSLLTFASFGFAAQSLLASLESVQFVSNVVLVRFLHGEIVTSRMLLATITIVAGNTLVVIFSSHAAVLFDSDEIVELYASNKPFLAYLCSTLVLFFVAEATFQRFHHARVVLNQSLWRHAVVEPLAYVVASAIIGAAAVLNAKCLSMLLQLSLRGMRAEHVLVPFWIILISWVGFVAFWLRRLDKGLELFAPLFFVPVIQVAFVFFAIVIGGVFFQEFELFSWRQWTGFCFGVAMILAGVAGLAPVDVDALSSQGPTLAPNSHLKLASVVPSPDLDDSDTSAVVEGGKSLKLLKTGSEPGVTFEVEQHAASRPEGI